MSLFDFKGLSKGERTLQYIFAGFFFLGFIFLFLAAFFPIGGYYSVQCESVNPLWKVPGIAGYALAVFFFVKRMNTDNNGYIFATFAFAILGALSFAGFFQ